MTFLLTPLAAFILYLVLVGVLFGIGRTLAGTQHTTSIAKTGAYSSGEAPPTSGGVPGYRPFFRVALFFAVLHLGVLVLASGGLSAGAGLYLIGLMLTLLTLILG